MGDYYDYFLVEGGVAVVCADVAGHGLASGITLSTLRGALMLVGDSLTQPAAVLQRLSTVVAQSSRRRMLVTMSLLLLDATRTDRSGWDVVRGAASLRPGSILRRRAPAGEAVDSDALAGGSESDVEGRVLWKQEGLQATRNRVKPRVPAKLLPPGDYVVILQGVRRGSAVEINNYTFTVMALPGRR